MKIRRKSTCIWCLLDSRYIHKLMKSSWHLYAQLFYWWGNRGSGEPVLPSLLSPMPGFSLFTTICLSLEDCVEQGCQQRGGWVFYNESPLFKCFGHFPLILQWRSEPGWTVIRPGSLPCTLSVRWCHRPSRGPLRYAHVRPCQSLEPASVCADTALPPHPVSACVCLSTCLAEAHSSGSPPRPSWLSGPWNEPPQLPSPHGTPQTGHHRIKWFQWCLPPCSMTAEITPALSPAVSQFCLLWDRDHDHMYLRSCWQDSMRCLPVVNKYLKFGRCSVIISCYYFMKMYESQRNYRDLKDFNNPETESDPSF